MALTSKTRYFSLPAGLPVFTSLSLSLSLFPSSSLLTSHILWALCPSNNGLMLNNLINTDHGDDDEAEEVGVEVRDDDEGGHDDEGRRLEAEVEQEKQQ